MSFAKFAGLGGLLVAGVLATTPASAAPALLGHAKGHTTNLAVEKVDWRPYRHCHRRWGRRYCHGGRRYKRWGGPGINVYIGTKPRYNRHRHHHRRWR